MPFCGTPAKQTFVMPRSPKKRLTRPPPQIVGLNLLPTEKRVNTSGTLRGTSSICVRLSMNARYYNTYLVSLRTPKPRVLHALLLLCSLVAWCCCFCDEILTCTYFPTRAYKEYEYT